VTGFGADLIVIDDPVKNRAQAESETFRNRVWDWYKDDLYTRLEPNGSIVLIQTRWHEEDLAGRLLRDNLDDWTVINLPALAEAASAMDNGQRKMESEEPDAETRLTLLVPPAVAGGCTSPVETDDGEFDSTDLSQEGRFTPALDTEPSGGKPAFPTEIASEDRSVPPPETIHSPQSIIRSPEIVHSPLSTVHCFDWRQPGEALCPERFDIDALDRLKTQLGTYAFSALFQQRPTPAGGQIFKREWFKQIIDFAPPGLNWKRGYDLAVSTRTESDYTASFRVAFDDNTGNLYISGGFRRRIEFPDQRRYIIDRIIHERDTEHGVELALHGQALMQELRRDPALRGRSFRGVKVSTDKLTRANTWAPIAEEGKVILVRTSVPPAVAGGALPSAARHRDDLETADTEISPPVKHHPLHPVHPVKNSPQPTHTDWISDLLDELSAFPNGTHDDQIDAISIAVHMHATKPNRAVGMLIT
jgi:predicted phage terminase large subunit-like protein